jgi:hypothetical protein
VSAFALRLAGAALVCLAIPATAAEPARNPAQSSGQEAGGSDAAAPAKPEKEKLICKTFPSSESRMKKNRICKTREDWRKADFRF